jgi:hypothetical protein
MTIENPSLHMPDHPHAMLSYDNVVTNVIVMESCDNVELIDSLKQAAVAADIVSCCTYGMATIGGTFDGTRFYPRKMFESFVWNANNERWSPPVVEPTDAVYRWDEPTVSWVFIRAFD